MRKLSLIVLFGILLGLPNRPVLGKTIFVAPGQSIQAALDGAKEAAVIELAQGTYS